jgi:hypothetical protein
MNDEANSWICYDFKNMQIEMIHYSIRSRRDTNPNHLPFWALQSSKDGLKCVAI